MRIFPYTKTAIEINDKMFNYSHKLFKNIEQSFKSVSGQKNDIRELIPEFFFFPEIFININSLEFGKMIIKKKKYEL